MLLPLVGTRVRWSLRVAVLLITGSLVFLASRVWLASYLYSSWDSDRLTRAAYLEPNNADYWSRLGLYEKWNFGRRDLRKAVLYYQRATKVNPRSDVYWMDLADAYEAVGQTAQARDAFENAQSAHPISSDVAWRYGNFLLRQKDYSPAFGEIRRALTSDPSLTLQAVSECSKVSEDISTLLPQVLPDQNSYYLVAMDYFLAQHLTDAALTTWNQLMALGQPANMEQVVPLIDELIVEQRLDDARGAWKQALATTGWPQDDAASHSSVVFNGGFEHESLNGAFDWREIPIAGASFGLDSNVVHAGKYALRVDFDGSANPDFQNLSEFCPVEPSHRYHFEAFLRLEGISTDSGMRLAISDTFHPAALQILTENLIGTHSWSAIEQDFGTGPETHLLTIAFRRVPSWKFDNKLRGTVWLDDVSLVPESTDPKKIPQ